MENQTELIEYVGAAIVVSPTGILIAHPLYTLDSRPLSEVMAEAEQKVSAAAPAGCRVFITLEDIVSLRGLSKNIEQYGAHVNKVFADNA